MLINLSIDPIFRDFFYILEGEASLVIDGTMHRLNRSDSILLYPGAVHQIRNESSDALNLLVVSSPECFTDKPS
ncbi:cupin domain-containing protein [Moorena sp. SIO3B2]|uniref:cupin domain-containing protein n=1 Tax=Moorena sp. SIO3B2 TaxID=2607827 RepID=UPI0013C7E6BE|nr:cupin domain-containing protein [Moorena sp. SIO3B2]